MCSQNQPKMFGGAMPLGTGGSMPPPTVYQANPQPTANVGFTPPPTPVNGSPAVASNPAQSPQPKGNPYQRWGTLMGGGMNPWGGRMGTLPNMKPGGGMMGY